MAYHAMMFEAFSAGYYVGQVYVQPYNGDRPVLQTDQHEQVGEQVYDEDTDARLPLVVKLGTRHLRVHRDAAVPTDTLALPADAARELDLHTPEPENVLVARGDHARRLLDMGV